MSKTAVHAGSGGAGKSPGECGIERRPMAPAALAKRRRSPWMVAVVTLLAVAGLAGTPVQAQEAPAQKRYELAKYILPGAPAYKSPIYPENLELCRAYEANLNAFPEVREPFVCERPIHPGFKDFSKPKWQELDPVEYIDLLVKMARAKYDQLPRLNPFNEKAVRKGISWRIALGHIRLKLAELDIAPATGSDSRVPDGIPEKVLRVERGDPDCDPADDTWRRDPPHREYYIANDDLTEVELFEKIIPMDVFLYKGKVYFDSFDQVSGIHRYEIYVYMPYGRRATPICRYRYIQPE